MRHPMLRAIIYLRELDGDCYDWCRAHCAARGYRLLGLVHDPDGTKWLRAIAALLAGQYEVIVRCPVDPLPPERVPRVEDAIVPIEVIEDVTPRRRRPRSPGHE